jgi:hypothetical protein
MCGIQDVITKGEVDETVCMFYDMIRTAGREMAIKTAKFKERNNWYDEQCKEKRHKLKPQRKCIKSEMMRRVGANIVVVRRNM